MQVNNQTFHPTSSASYPQRDVKHVSELSRLNYTQEMFSLSMETGSSKQHLHTLYLQPHDDSCKPGPCPSTQVAGWPPETFFVSFWQCFATHQSLPAPNFCPEGKQAASCGKVWRGPLEEQGERLQIGKFEVLHTAAAQQSFIHC